MLARSWMVTAIIFFTVARVGFAEQPAALARSEPNAGTQLVEIDSLKFDAPQLQRRFANFNTAARQLADGEFDYRPHELGGSFVTAVWTKGIGFTEPCVLRGPRESLKGIHRITVEAIVVPFPQAEAAGLNVEVVAPDPNGWCVAFHYCEGNKQHVVGQGWGCVLYRWNPVRYGNVVPFQPYDEARERVTLPVHGYSVRDNSVKLQSKLRFQENFVRHFRSATAMRDVYLDDLARLEERVLTFIRDHLAHKRVYGESAGGIPPPFREEPLSAEEEDAELAKAKQHFAAQAKLMRDHSESLYAAWSKSFPLERCWPELGDK